jgi:F-type H+-transporting ATPase subunit b
VLEGGKNLKTRAKKAGLLGAMAIAANAAFPVLAFAEEEASGIATIIPDPLEFFPMLVAFILLWIILAKFGWPMFNGMLEKRENTIREALKKSEEAQIESERVLEEYQKQLTEAKQEANQVIADARATGEAVKADIQAKAQAEAAEIIAKAKQTIEAEKKAAIAELQGLIADTSVDVAARLIGNDLTEGDHRAIIEKYVKEAGSFNGN